MRKSGFFLLAFLCLIMASCGVDQSGSEKTAEELPNIIIIYCDDLGYADVGCFGAKDIKTPNIDRLATEGIKFTEFYSAANVCSPSRAALLTGRIPERMGIAGVFFPNSHTGMPVNEITLANILKDRGYATGHVGKWHLGHLEKYLPLQRGFDSYFGIPYSNDMESVVYYRDNEVVDFDVDQHYTTKRYAEEAVKFISANNDKHFFLYLAHTMPHVPLYVSEDFEGTSERGLFGDVIQEIDWSVGEIFKTLESHDILDNTLIIFSSDNGPWLVMEDHGGSAGVLREGKQFSFEGGHRVPTLAMWPAKIPAGSSYDDMALMCDWVPTITKIVGAELPTDRDYDGTDITEVLFGSGHRDGPGMLFYEFGELEGYREGDWKVKLAYSGFKGNRGRKAVAAHPALLINLKEDPGEQNNLAVKMPDKLAEMLHKMDSAVLALGELPPNLVINSKPDHSHYEYLTKKHGRDDYWKAD